MAGRPGEVSPRWAAKKLGMDYQTISRWCRETREIQEAEAREIETGGRRPLVYLRTEFGGRRRPKGGDDIRRHVKRYWLSEIEIRTMALDVSCESAAENSDTE